MGAVGGRWQHTDAKVPSLASDPVTCTVIVRQGRHRSMHGISLADIGLLLSSQTAVPCKIRERIGSLHDRSQ